MVRKYPGRSGLFKATSEDYRNPGELGGPLTPEQAALPGAVGNPIVGLATAGLVTAGVALAGAGAGTAISGALNTWKAYQAANASYWMGTALGTGVVIGGGSYTLGAVGGAFYNQQFGAGQDFSTGFSEQFSFPGLAAAATVGGLTGMYSTAMFGWAGVPNALNNLKTLSGVIIRANSFALGQSAGHATQAGINSGKK